MRRPEHVYLHAQSKTVTDATTKLRRNVRNVKMDSSKLNTTSSLELENLRFLRSKLDVIQNAQSATVICARSEMNLNAKLVENSSKS